MMDDMAINWLIAVSLMNNVLALSTVQCRIKSRSRPEIFFSQLVVASSGVNHRMLVQRGKELL